MSGVSITGLNPASTLTGSEIVPIVQNGTTVRTTVANMGPVGSFTQSGTGAVTTTIQSKLRETVSVKDFGAVGDGVTDDTTAFNNAIAAISSTGQTLYVPAGTYKITSVLSTNGNLDIVGEGEKTILDFSSITSASSGITVTGTATSIQTISFASSGGFTITFSSAPSLTTGDVFCIYEPATLWNSIRSYYYSGEWLECRGTSGLTATTTNPLYSSYSAGTAVYKLSSPKVSFKNFKIIGGANLNGLIKTTFCDKPLFENIIAYNENSQAIEIDRCYRPVVNNCFIYNKGTGTSDDYGLVIGNSQKVQITGGDYYARRHGIALGGGDYVCAVPCRNVKISNLTISNDINSQVYSADMHGNTQDVVYQGCTIYQGGGLGGMDNGYDNCLVYNQYGGVCFYGSEIKGGDLFVRNCKIYTKSDPNSVIRGIIDIGGNSNALTTSTDKTTNIIIENCYLYADAVSSSTDFVKVGNSGSLVNVNININGITANVNAMGSVLRTLVNSGTANSEAIIVDNIHNFPSSTYLHYAQGGAYLNKPQRLMSQTGTLSITATSGTNATNAATQNYKYQYPRIPQATVSIGSLTIGYTNSAGENIGATIFQIREEGIRPALVSTSNANWTATATMTVNWIVGLAEI